MSDPRELWALSRETLRRETLGKSSRVPGENLDGGERPDGSEPALGSLWVFGDSPLPVEWLLIESSEEGHRLLPVDSAPFVGPSDRELVDLPSHPRGVVRCAPDLALEWITLDGATRVGAFEGPTSEAVLGHWRRAQEGRLAPSTLEEETELDPAHGEWIRELAAEGRRLAGRDGAGRAQGAGAGATVVALPRVPPAASEPGPRVGGPWPGAWRLAAAMLLGAGLSMLVGRLWHEGEVAELERRLAEADARAAHGSESPLVSPEKPKINLPIAWLGSETALRGEEAVLRIEPATEWVLVVLDAPSAAAESYRVELRTDAAEVLWSTGGVRPSPLGELSLSLPTSMLESAPYRLAVEAEEKEGATAGSEPVELLFEIEMVDSRRRDPY